MCLLVPVAPRTWQAWEWSLGKRPSSSASTHEWTLRDAWRKQTSLLEMEMFHQWPKVQDTTAQWNRMKGYVESRKMLKPLQRCGNDVWLYIEKPWKHLNTHILEAIAHHQVQWWGHKLSSTTCHLCSSNFSMRPLMPQDLAINTRGVVRRKAQTWGVKGLVSW